MSTAYVMFGTPSPEKTAAMQELSKRTGAVIMSLDEELKRGLERSGTHLDYVKRNAFPDVLERFFAKAREALREGKSVILETSAFREEWGQDSRLPENGFEWKAQLESEHEVVAIAPNTPNVDLEHSRAKEGWSRIENVDYASLTNSPSANGVAWVDVEKVLGDKIQYAAYLLQDFEVSHSDGYGIKIDAPHIKIDGSQTTWNFNPSTAYLAGLINNAPATTEFQITGYGRDDKNEGLSASNPHTAGFVTNPYITIGMTPSGTPGHTEKLEFAPFSSNPFGRKSFQNVKTLDSTANVKSISRPKNIPKTVTGTLAFRLRGEEKWVTIDELKERIKEDRSYHQGYTVKLHTPEARKAALFDQIHFDSRESCEAWCRDYLKNLPENFKGEERIDCVSDDGQTHLEFSATEQGVSLNGEFASWDQFRELCYVSTENQYCSGLYDDGRRQSLNDCINEVANDKITELCTGRNVFICDAHGNQIAKCSLDENNSLRVDYFELKETINYELPPSIVERIESARADIEENSQAHEVSCKDVNTQSVDVNDTSTDPR